MYIVYISFRTTNKVKFNDALEICENGSFDLDMIYQLRNLLNCLPVQGESFALFTVQLDYNKLCLLILNKINMTTMIRVQRCTKHVAH